MRSEIIKLHEKLGATFIYVTHDQVEAMTMGTRIVVMKDGFVQQIGAPKELYSRPVNTFVAGFIGTPQINFFNGRLTPDGKLRFANDQEITLSKATMDKFDAEKIGSGIDVIMGIRPGDLKLVDNGDKATTVVAKVEVVEALGNETIVYSNLDLNGAQSLERTATSITLSAKLKSDPERHSKIFLDIDEDYIHLFDKETEVSIRK